MIYAIVTADRNWGIGKNGSQVTTIPDDIRYIRSVTSGQIAVMGRKTFEKIPSSQLQINRKNVVLTTDGSYSPKGAVTCSSAEELLALAKETGTDVYVLGGGKTFVSLLPYFDEIQVTHIDYAYDADTYFPDLDKLPEWVLVEESEEQTHFDTVYYLKRYLKRTDYRP